MKPEPPYLLTQYIQFIVDHHFRVYKHIAHQPQGSSRRSTLKYHEIITTYKGPGKKRQSPQMIYYRIKRNRKRLLGYMGDAETMIYYRTES